MARPPADAPLLNPELIYTTALRLIDQNGLEALSMRKLAAELDVTPRSLYHYVDTKDALLREVYKVVLTELELPDFTDNWISNLKEVARNFRKLCHKHQNVATYFLGGHPPVERDTAVYEILFSVLLKAGLPKAKLIAITRALITFLVGYILAELNGTFELERWRSRRVLAEKTPEHYPVFLQLPNPSESAEENFEIALEVLLGGLEELSANK